MLKMIRERVKERCDETILCPPCLVSFINPYSYLQLRKNQNWLKGIDTLFIDGVAMVWLFRLVGFGPVERVSFDSTSLAPLVFDAIEHDNKSIFFVGAREGEVERATNHWKNSWPNMRVIGARNGYFCSADERDSFLDELVVINPDVIVVGMGAVLQEKFLSDLYMKSWRGMGFTCGGYIHQTALFGINYYPKLIDRYNLRWLYRIIREPKLISRYLISYPLFLVLFMVDLLKYKLCVRK